MLRVVGIVALFVLAACGQDTVQSVASPSPVIPQGNWTQNVKFTGDVPGQMTGIVADSATQTSVCTGSRTRNGETWSDSFYGTLDSSGRQWGVVFVIGNFRGPGTYANTDVRVEMHSIDTTRVWENQAGDKVTFTMGRNQQTGTVDALLTSADSGKAGAEHLTGTWNCKG